MHAFDRLAFLFARRNRKRHVNSADYQHSFFRLDFAICRA